MRARLERRLPDDGCHGLGAELEGRVVGMAGPRLSDAVERDTRYDQIAALVVDERSRGAGIGATLLAASERWLQDQGVDTVVVLSSHRRVEAHRCYERHGYHPTSLRFVKNLDRHG